MLSFHLTSNTAAGTGEEHNVRVNPVNIKVVAVEAFPGPQGGAFKRPCEGGQVAQFDKGLTNVQIAAACRPVVISGLSVGDHHFETGRRAIIQGLLVFKVHFNIGIGLVSQTTDSPAGFPAGVM